MNSPSDWGMGHGPGAERRLQRIRFGEYLFERQHLTEEQLLAALADHWSNGGTIGAAICRHGFLDRDQVERLADEYHSLDVVEI